MDSVFHLKQLKLDEHGLSKVLGFLEAEVMEVVWAAQDASVRDICESFKKKKAYSFNTIMTVMNRLVEKNLLEKKSVRGAFVYHATVAREQFLHQVTKSVVSALVQDGSLFQVAAFVEALKECSAEDLALLQSIRDATK